jgi:hypothetical protein
MRGPTSPLLPFMSKNRRNKCRIFAGATYHHDNVGSMWPAHFVWDTSSRSPRQDRRQSADHRGFALVSLPLSR